MGRRAGCEDRRGIRGKPEEISADQTRHSGPVLSTKIDIMQPFITTHGAPMIPESTNPDRDYPQMAAERGRIEPAPRRVRGYFDNTLVFDTTRARYVWEVPYYPQYYIPLSDVRVERLLDENHSQRLQ